MSTNVEKSIEVNLPVSTVYNQWTQFEDFPQFMSGVTSVTQLSDDRLEWIAEIAGVRRRWEAKIVEQVPERKIAWAATEGATNAGAVTFQDLGDRTVVHLSLEYEPEGLVEKVGDKLNVVENRAKGDLERFKNFIESEGYATGAWRGSVNPSGVGGTPSVDDADASRGDQGKAGVSGKAVAAGLGAAAVAAAGTAAGIAAAGKSNESTTTPVERVEPDQVAPAQVAPAPPAPVPGEPPRAESSPTRRPARSSRTPRTCRETRTTTGRPSPGGWSAADGDLRAGGRSLFKRLFSTSASTGRWFVVREPSRPPGRERCGRGPGPGRPRPW